MRVQWDPHPTFPCLPVWKPNPTVEERDADTARMWELYAGYAASLDRDHPMWPYEILTIAHPPRELVEMAKERRDRD